MPSCVFPSRNTVRTTLENNTSIFFLPNYGLLPCLSPGKETRIYRFKLKQRIYFSSCPDSPLLSQEATTTSFLIWIFLRRAIASSTFVYSTKPALPGGSAMMVALGDCTRSARTKSRHWSLWKLSQLLLTTTARQNLLSSSSNSNTSSSI